MIYKLKQQKLITKRRLKLKAVYLQGLLTVQYLRSGKVFISYLFVQPTFDNADILRRICNYVHLQINKNYNLLLNLYFGEHNIKYPMYKYNLKIVSEHRKEIL